MPNALSDAKTALSHATKSFPSSAAPTAAPKAASTVSKPSMSIGEPEKGIAAELKSKERNVNEYTAALPKMHNGGPVPADGGYQLKKGEHVLTAAEALKARKHALMASGMSSLAKGAMKTPQPKTAGEPEKLGAKKTTSTGVKTTPEKK
jgi:hypothetical protein